MSTRAQSRHDEVTTELPAGELPELPIQVIDEAPQEVAPPSERYLVIEEVGRGGMGVVRRAYDPKLQREVALKVLRGDMLDEQARARMVREARAMAKLSHPNVVAVYDAEVEHGVTLVMEYVAGQTLRHWLRAEPRTPAAIVDVFVHAGRGLVAAHAQGILHRDFKPANVLMGRDGRPRVTDFGLARLEGVDPSSSDVHMTQQSGESLSGTLTETGQVLGTPRYMAPEQLEGEPLTESVDQYAWCVSLWEALVGRAPFETRALRGLAMAKKQGPPPWPKDVVVSPRIVEALMRGLAVEPKARFPSMEALLAAVTEVPAPRRGWQRAGVGVVVASAVAGAWLVGRTPRAQCTGAAEQLAVAWSDEHRAAAEAAVLGTGLVYAADTWERVGPQLDTYAEVWVEQHTAACEATTVRGEQSAAAMDLRMGCLQRARVDLRAVVELLERADADVVERAHGLVDGLPPLSRCEDLEVLESEVPPPAADVAEAVADVREGLAAVAALDRAGKYADARRAVEALRSRVEELAYAPLGTEHARLAGEVATHDGRFADSEAALRQALRGGLAQGQWDEARGAAIGLAYLVGTRQARMAEGLAFAATAQGLLDRRPDPVVELALRGTVASIWAEAGELERAEAEQRAVLEQCTGSPELRITCESTIRDNLGSTLHARGKYAEAEAQHRMTLELRQAELGPKHPWLASSMNNLANVLARQGKLVEAEAQLRAVLALEIEGLGPTHPYVADVYSNLGNTLARRGELAAAEAEYRRAVAIIDPKSPNLGAVLGNLGNVLVEQGKLEEAETTYRRSLELQSATWGPRHPNVVVILINLGTLLSDQGKLEPAEELQRRALELQRELVGSEHLDTAIARYNLGQTLRRLGRYAEAEAELRGALATISAQLPPDNSEHVRVRIMLGELLLGTERPAEVLPLLDRDPQATDDADRVPALRATRAFLVARALWRVGGKLQRARALEQARLALATFEEAGFYEDEADVSKWIEDPR